MPTSRPNPTDGLLDLFHEDTNTWVRAVALLQIAGGLNVKLTGDQEDLLAAIGVDVQKLQNLLAELQGARTAINTLNTLTESVRANLQNNVTPSLSAISTKLSDIETLETNLLSKVDATRLVVADVTNVALADIASRTINYSTPLADINLSLATINSKTVDFSAQWVINNTELGSIDDRLTTANTTLTSLDTRLTTANTTLTSVDTRLATVNTNLTNLQTAITNLRPTSLTVATLVLNLTDTQFSYTIPANTKRLSFKVRRDASGNSYDVRYSLVAGQVANPATGTYRTLDSFNEFSESFNNLTGATLYLASTSASAGNNITVEIEVLA